MKKRKLDLNQWYQLNVSHSLSLYYTFLRFIYKQIIKMDSGRDIHINYKCCLFVFFFFKPYREGDSVQKTSRIPDYLIWIELNWIVLGILKIKSLSLSSLSSSLTLTLRLKDLFVCIIERRFVFNIQYWIHWQDLLPVYLTSHSCMLYYLSVCLSVCLHIPFFYYKTIQMAIIYGDWEWNS